MGTNKVALKIEQMESGLPLPLYWDYGGEESRAFICLDTQNGEVWCKEKAPWENGMTLDEFHGRVRTYHIPNNLTVGGLNALLGDQELQSLWLRVLSGAFEEWDGSNWRTKLTMDAEQADFRATMFCEEVIPNGYGALQVCDAFMYLDQNSYADLAKEGESLKGATDRIVMRALKDGVYLTWENTLAALEAKSEGRGECEVE